MATKPQLFGDVLRRLRSEAGLTQEELAERAGMSVRSVSDLERGRNRFPYRATVQRLVEVLRPTESDIEELWALAIRRKGPAARRTPTRSVNLPRPLTSILGRERESSALLHMLRWEGARLVTLTGPGGVGKTRLALHLAAEAASDYADGVSFVSLADIDDAALIPTGVLTALSIRAAGGVTPEQALLARLADQEHLLVLDNLEQVRDPGPFLAELLSFCPRLKTLVTSRVPLGVRGERQFDVAPLAVPTSRDVTGPDDLLTSPATALFLERARDVNAALDVTSQVAGAIAEICRRLDGLPLAIELAAAQVKYRSPEALLTQLDRRFEALTEGYRDSPARQQSLRETIEWSYRLLQPEEQRLFRRLSVFAGGATVEAAEAVCAGDPGQFRDGLHALRDASLLTLDGTSPESVRVRMLETIREYAQESLSASGETDLLRERHLAFFLQLAEEADPHLIDSDQTAWLTRLEEERANVFAALEWAYERGHAIDGARLLTSLRLFFEAHGPPSEVKEWLERFMAAGRGALERDDRLHAQALKMLGRLYWIQGEVERAEGLFQEALSVVRRSEQPRGEAGLLNYLGGIAHDKGDLDRAMRFYQEGLAVATANSDRWFVAAIYTNLGNLASDRGELERAETWLNHALDLLRELGDKRVIGMNLNVLGEVFRAQGMVGQAEASFRDALVALYEVTDRPNLGYSLECLARIARDRGEMVRAARLAGAADSIQEESGMTRGPAERSAHLQVTGDCERALGNSAAVAAREEGAAMSLDEIVEYALGTS